MAFSWNRSSTVLGYVSSWSTVKETVAMKPRNKRKPVRPKSKLGLPNLEHAKAAVVGSLPSAGSQREYCRSINEFVAWYCSELRLSFSKTVVTRFRMYLEERQLAPATITLRLAAVRADLARMGRYECSHSPRGPGFRKSVGHPKRSRRRRAQSRPRVESPPDSCPNTMRSLAL